MTSQPVGAADDEAATDDTLERIEAKLDAMLDLLGAVAEAFGPRVPFTLRAKLAAAQKLRRI